jgi:biopolymer transport protein ExbD
MTKRLHSKVRTQETPELDITTFLNLMVVLIPFLLISAVFSRVTILELSVPTSAGGSGSNTPNFAIEVIVRKAGFEIANGSSVEAAIPKKDGQYDMKMLSEMLMRLKARYPEKEDATVLMEPDIEYDYLIQIMDAVRGAEIRPEGLEEAGAEGSPATGPEENPEGSQEVQRIVLFPDISIGDAP